MYVSTVVINTTINIILVHSNKINKDETKDKISQCEFLNGTGDNKYIQLISMQRHRYKYSLVCVP